MRMKASRYAAASLSCAAAAMCILAAGSGPVQADVRRDPKAVAVADAIEAAVAPGGAWGKVACLKFAFTVVREGKTLKSYQHVWDTRTGTYRVEGEGPDGGNCLVLFDVNTKKGDAWMLGPPGGVEPLKVAGSPAAQPVWVKQSGESATKLLEYGYGRFINDTYWLLMPIKLKDPGVNLDYDGEKTEGGDTFDVVKLTFAGVGLTPGDTYWVWVNRKTHVVDRWEYVLQGQEAKDKGSWLWKDWSSFGPLRLSTTKTKPDGKVSITFTGVEALPQVPPGAFDPPR